MGQESISTTLSFLFSRGHRALEVKGSMYSKKTLVKDIKPRREPLLCAFHLKVIVSDTGMLLPAGGQILTIINKNLLNANFSSSLLLVLSS